MRSTIFWFGLAFIVPLSRALLPITECKPGQFKCTNNGECLDAKQRCDHVADCPDGADERECEYQCKSPHMQQCRDGHCIALYFFCDGKNDCGDWSDELNCTSTMDGLTSSNACPSHQFKCDAGHIMCIPNNWVCDTVADCDNGKDELHCNITTTCNNGFKCGSKECILNQWVCDGTHDCVDGSDEDQCGPDAFMSHSCLEEHGWFSCMVKGSKKCMPIQRACDSFNDCDNHSDEGGLCSVTSCNATGCPNGCKPTPTGPVCQCPLGLRFDGKSCIDIDECSVQPPLCSQKCTNTIGGFQCSCISGYSLSKRNNRTCEANGPEVMLLISTDRDIRFISLPSNEYGLIQSGVSQAHSVSSYYEDEFIFWTEKSKDKAGIFKSLLDGSAHQYVVSVGVESVEDLAIDWIGRHIYFTDSGRKHIVACDIHGTLCTVVVTGQLDKPRAIAVYPEERFLFWSDWGSRPHIACSGMDGSNRKDIITTDIAWPNGLAVDETIRRIFWSDAKLSRIESSRLDGTDRIILPVTVNHPYAIDIFENLVYWCDPVAHEVQSCDKFTGKNVKVLIKEASLTPTGVHIHHPSRQRPVENPCWNVICSHLCLLSPSEPGFKCACPHGMTLNRNNRTCDQVSGIQSSVIIATYTDLYQLTHHQIGRDSIVHLPTRILENIGALAFNPLGHSVVYSDIGRKIIYSMHLETYRETILFENAELVEGLAVDPYTENIYWTEVSQGTVLVGHINREGARERIILARGLHSPKDIALAPELGLMFIVEGRTTHVINVWNMDGTGKEELVQVYGTVSAMSYDRKHLYFSDSLRGTIERIGIDGQDRTILRSHQGSPVAMDVSSDSIFWLIQYSSRINWISKQETKTTRGFIIDAGAEELVDQYRIITVVDHFGYEDEHLCLGHTGGCSDICVPTRKDAKCLCPLGKELSADMHSCTPINCSDSSEWFKCQSGCIPVKHRCDGIQDCPSGEDEMGCRNETTLSTCSSFQFQCRSGGCIASAFVCDGEYDCHDKSDEPESCAPHQCFADEVLCPGQRRCIPMSAKCDGQSDCSDGWDELNCTITSIPCSSSQFYCKDSGLCIPLTWVCDKDPDCEHGEDERESMCNSGQLSTCPVNYLRCPPRSDCIPRMALCNGVADCEFANEEELCAKLKNHSTEKPDPSDCSSNEFTCYLGSNECLPLSAKCNCKFECNYGEDEEGCPVCEQGFYRCPNEMRYVKTTWLCDGLMDCLSGADESPELCPNKTSSTIGEDDSPCSPDEFECVDGQCIPFSLTCDGIRNCPDGTDEGISCNKSCENNGQCPHICIPGPNEGKCECHPGYISQDNGRTCIDIDECKMDNGCSQYCNNTKGSYRCWCAPGYQLEHDHQTCKVLNGRPMLIISNSHSVEALINYGADSRRLTHSPSVIKGIAYHDRLSTLYWVTAEGINRSDSKGRAVVYKWSTGLSPSGLELDRATGNLYVSGMITINGTTSFQQDRSIIRVISATTTPVQHVDIIVTQTIITDIAIEANLGLLFWSEHVKPHSGRIIRSAMDGSSSLWLTSITKIIYPVALTVDPIQSRVYWADIRLQSISSSDYFGQRQKLVVSNTNGLPLSLSFFENRVSWTNVDQENVRSQVINTHVSLVQVLHERAGHLLTVHAVLEPELPNPCASSSCGNGLCLLKNSTIAQCMCHQGVTIMSISPFKCRSDPAVVVHVVTQPPKVIPADEEAGRNPDEEEIKATPGVTVASILICLAVFTVLAVLGWIYYKRWRQTIGSPLKFRFRTALGMTEESTSNWEESVDYSDRKMLYIKSDDPDDDENGGHPQIVVDHNDNRTGVLTQTDSAYASQQSLAKQQQIRSGSVSAEEHQPQQLLPVTYSMKDQLLASEL